MQSWAATTSPIAAGSSGCATLNLKILSRYRSRDWKGALAVIDEGRAADEESRFATLYNVYTGAHRRFSDDPAPDDWDGAYALETK